MINRTAHTSRLERHEQRLEALRGLLRQLKR
jgi:hypothetical protein